ncbi:hypothetical protein [Mycobacterium sp. 1274761.0]|uniref:hypothetical protein n=1 Tax=Mycobacterium sp. 1274761.0 TaxID=1834077 RepID=UPI0007FE1091|nr:hypothetical protein [Mycobacterium sp. 1274761.0]OBK74060.1 hypothetical protein A5651_12270 [Mycobacterium sp. 1274761.0]
MTSTPIPNPLSGRAIQYWLTDLAHNLTQALQTLGASPPSRPRPERRLHPPERLTFLENSLMAREMRRL